MTDRREMRTFLGAVAVLVVSVLLAACGEDDDSNGGGSSAGGQAPKTIAVSHFTREVPYFQEILKGMREKGKEFGWKVEPSFANNDPKQQIDQLQNIITKQPDAIVVAPIDEQALAPPFRQAKRAGIPVISMGDNIAEEARDAQLAFLGVDYETLGAQKAEFIVDELGGKGKVGFIHALRGLNFTEQQDKGAKAVFENHPQIELIDGPFAGLSSDEGLTATENLLSRERDLDAIYYDHDDLALGGIRAIGERGIDHDEILIVGTDGGPAALNAVKRGTLDMTVSLCGFRQGKQVMDVLRQFLVNDKKPEPLILTKTEFFTPDNFEEQIAKVYGGEC